MRLVSVNAEALHQAVVRYCFKNGLTIPEVAKKMGVPAEALRGWMYRGARPEERRFKKLLRGMQKIGLVKDGEFVFAATDEEMRNGRAKRFGRKYAVVAVGDRRVILGD